MIASICHTSGMESDNQAMLYCKDGEELGVEMFFS